MLSLSQTPSDANLSCSLLVKLGAPQRFFLASFFVSFQKQHRSTHTVLDPRLLLGAAKEEERSSKDQPKQEDQDQNQRPIATCKTVLLTECFRDLVGFQSRLLLLATLLVQAPCHHLA